MRQTECEAEDCEKSCVIHRLKSVGSFNGEIPLLAPPMVRVPPFNKSNTTLPRCSRLATEARGCVNSPHEPRPSKSDIFPLPCAGRPAAGLV